MEFLFKALNVIYRKQGCPMCKKSKGELLIEKILISNNINYIKQKTFNGCYNKRKLPFDFYLPEFNMCIEYDGVQHYNEINYWGGITYLEYVKNHDNIKTLFCGKII